ncbi:MAG: YCF48-related protein [Prolixibacteraceae bacterium]|jgi:hypothetical protein|nr:YCF48-related protein [Prolixibacteraceae bacterium]
MKKLLIAIAFFLPFLNSCNEGFDWDPNNYKVIVLDNENEYYHFHSGEVYTYENAPEDVWTNGIVNEPWCTDLPALCGNFEITDYSSFDEIDEIPDGEYSNDCKELPLNKVIVYRLEDETYGLVKIVNDEYSMVNDMCQHRVTLHVIYPVTMNIAEKEEDEDSNISNGTWSFAAKSIGINITGISSFDKLFSSVYVSGWKTFSGYSNHIGEIGYESEIYRDYIETPNDFGTDGLQCFGDGLIYVLGQSGEVAKYNDKTSEWIETSKIEGIYDPQSIFFVREDIGFVSSSKKLHRTYSQLFDWTEVYKVSQGGGKVFSPHESVVFFLKDYGSDYGTIYRGSGLDYTPYEFPMHWYEQPSATHANGLFFQDIDRGWICADYGQIIKTTNSGKNWEIIRHGSVNDPHLYDIEFTSDIEGWACGAAGTILHTIDGGETWETVDVGEPYDFIDIEFNSPFCGWVTTASNVYWYIDEDKFMEYFRNLNSN